MNILLAWGMLSTQCHGRHKDKTFQKLLQHHNSLFPAQQCWKHLGIGISCLNLTYMNLSTRGNNRKRGRKCLYLTLWEHAKLQCNTLIQWKNPDYGQRNHSWEDTATSATSWDGKSMWITSDIWKLYLFIALYHVPITQHLGTHTCIKIIDIIGLQIITGVHSSSWDTDLQIPHCFPSKGLSKWIPGVTGEEGQWGALHSDSAGGQLVWAKSRGVGMLETQGMLKDTLISLQNISLYRLAQ